MSEAREYIWTKIGESIIEIWPSIQIIFEQHELLQEIQRSNHAD